MKATEVGLVLFVAGVVAIGVSPLVGSGLIAVKLIGSSCGATSTLATPSLSVFWGKMARDRYAVILMESD